MPIISEKLFSRTRVAVSAINNIARKSIADHLCMNLAMNGKNKRNNKKTYSIQRLFIIKMFT